MIDNVHATASLLSGQYGLKSGSSVVSGLLAPQTQSAFSSLGILDANYGGGGSAAEANLTQFVKDYVPNNNKLLSDINAVFALQGLSGKSELPTTAAFVNPYTKALALGAGDGTGDAASTVENALISLIS